MHFSKVIVLAATGLAVQAATIPKLSYDLNYAAAKRDVNLRRRALLVGRQDDNQRGGGRGGGGGGNDGGAGETCLASNAIQSASAETGQDGEIAAGQIESATDAANFINFCAGETLTNGEQNTGGSCNGVVMGKIPSTSNMVSSIIVFPAPGDVIDAGTTFSIDVQVQGLDPGAFTNAASTYYSAPQDLNGQGQIIGHTHVTVQDMGGSFTPSNPMDPTRFAFFKGINDEGNGQGLLSATVTGGLPEGFYRVCTMSSASNHQPVLMPVAQRGAQDDCTKFEVRAGGDAGNGSGGGGAGDGNEETDGSTDPDSDADPTNDNDDNTGADPGTEEPTTTSESEEPSETAEPDNGGGDNGGNDEEPTTTEDSAAEPTEDAEPTDDSGSEPTTTEDSDSQPTDDAEPSEDSGSEPTDIAPEPTEAPSEEPSEAPAEPTSTRRRFGSGRGRNRFKNREKTATSAAEAEATPAPEETEAAEPVTGNDGEAQPDLGGETGADPEVPSTGGNEAPVEEAPVEEAPAEESPVEETPAEAPVDEDEGIPIPVASGNLGGPVPTVKRTGRTNRPFCVLGNTFTNEAAAVSRACDVQKNRCADAVNGGRLEGVSVGDCEAQRAACGA